MHRTLQGSDDEVPASDEPASSDEEERVELTEEERAERRRNFEIWYQVRLFCVCVHTCVCKNCNDAYVKMMRSTVFLSILWLYQEPLFVVVIIKKRNGIEGLFACQDFLARKIKSIKGECYHDMPSNFNK